MHRKFLTDFKDIVLTALIDVPAYKDCVYECLISIAKEFSTWVNDDGSKCDITKDSPLHLFINNKCH